MKKALYIFLLLLGPSQPFRAQQWIGRYQTNGSQGPWQPTSLFVPGNGVMKLPPGNSPWSYFWTNFENTISLCTGNQMAIEARIMNPASGGGVDAYDASLSVTGNCGTVWATLMGSGWAQTYSSVGRNHSVFGTTSVSNQPSLVQNLSTYGILRIEVNLTNIVYRWNGAVIYTLPTANGGIGETIQQIGLSFKGSGSLDFLRVWNWAGALVYDEGFEDVIFAAASPCSFPLASCSSILPIEFSSFTVVSQASGFKLDWETAHESGVTGFEIQRSDDQQQFETVGYLQSTDRQTVYSSTDLTSSPTQYYRIVAVNQEGNRFFSSVVLATRETAFEIGKCYYANSSVCIPVIDGTGDVVELFDLQGRLLYQGMPKVNDSGLIRIHLQLDGGGYFIRVHSLGGEFVTRRFWVL